ncbi:NPC intracellular cholesterol transporter 2-like [Teleopsis dalmanni]|uniref:NPC intracellular cholesterol transporter 2-like n=1 Tax=Teleopsis dalmanni TaxID=139649 RepID=UPI0018CE7117|nr:NPC intracellular cholesterol transporter 2-like [Teleopsis dalmanni]
MIARLVVFVIISAFSTVLATDVKKCSGDKPFPLSVNVTGCETPPCDILKGSTVEMFIHFVSHRDVSELTTKVKAYTFGISVPYELPEETSNVCRNLMYGAYCPLYPTEDVTYLFLFPVGSYPEISVKIEIYLVDQDDEIATCFICDIKVKKGNSKLELSYE